MSDTVLLAIENHIATLTLNRPQHMNSLNDEMAETLLNKLKEIESHPEISIVHLKGAGACFMAGGDIQFFQENLTQMADTADQIIQCVHEVIERLTSMPKIIIASVHGSVAGFGLSLMLACDLVASAQDTKFTMAYTKIGASCDGGASFHLPRVVGQKRAMELLLLSPLIDAETAKAYGLINWIVDPEKLLAHSAGIAACMSHGPLLAYQNIKRLLRATYENSLPQQLTIEKEAFIECAKSQDFAAGVNAFINKTQPNYQGK